MKYNKVARNILLSYFMFILVSNGTNYSQISPQVAEATHNANLFVSAENSQFNSFFAGPQVVEVVIIDPAISDTDEGKGEPDVTINGKKLRMAQATDGNWYAYFASKQHAQLADGLVGADGKGLDFGTFCDQSTNVSGIDLFSQTVGFSTSRASGSGTDGTEPFVACTTAPTSTTLLNHVVRENKALNTAVGLVGQIGIDIDAWPVIQLFNFSSGGNVVIKYNKGGGTQTTTLNFNSIPSSLVNALPDRNNYPRGAQIHVTLTDPQLNIDPTDEDSWTWDTNPSNNRLFYQLFDETGAVDADGFPNAAQNIINNLTELMFEKNGRLTVNPAAQGDTVADFVDNNNQVYPSATIPGSSRQMTFTETGPNSGVFRNYDESDKANFEITSSALRGKSATISYNAVSKSIVAGFETAKLKMGPPAATKWSSGEKVPVVLEDGDSNKNSRADEDLDVFNLEVSAIPTLKIGNPFTLKTGDRAIFTSATIQVDGGFGPLGDLSGSINSTALLPGQGTVQSISQRAILAPDGTISSGSALVIGFTGRNAEDLFKSINNPAGSFNGLNMFNYDFRSINPSITGARIYLLYGTTPIIDGTGLVGTDLTAISIANVTSTRGLVSLNSTDIQTEDATIINSRIFSIPSNNEIGLLFDFNDMELNDLQKPIVADFFSFGLIGDGVKKNDRINNAIYRFELEETGDNTSKFVGTAEYAMLNQINIFDDNTFKKLVTIDDDVTFIVHEDLDGKDSPRISYSDLGSDGVVTTISSQLEAGTTSGSVLLDKDSYKLGDTVTVTLNDNDLNVDSDLIDIYTTVNPVQFPNDPAVDTVGRNGLGRYSDGEAFGRLLDITFNDVRWSAPIGSVCQTSLNSAGLQTGLYDSGFTMIETGIGTGIFKGDFKLPKIVCDKDATGTVQTTGLNIEVNYVDFRDASSQTIEVGDAAGIRGSSGSISLDRSVYPVPFGKVSDFPGIDNSFPVGRSIFPVNSKGITGTIQTAETIGEGEVTVHIRVNDPDFNTSASGEDKIAQNTESNVGPVKVTVSRGSNKVTLGYAGGPSQVQGPIDVGDNNPAGTRQFGPLVEISPSAGIFQIDITILYTDGPANIKCPASGSFTNIVGSSITTVGARFDDTSTNKYCILQGDVLTVQYTDPTDASGSQTTVTDSATFDLRNGVLQSDKSVYVIGSDMILTLIDPDLNLDSYSAENYDLDLILWDSDAARLTMGDLGGSASNNGKSFDPEPSAFRETGDNTGIFQVSVEIPQSLGGKNIDRGERIKLEYTDWGPSGADYVGEEEEDVNLTIFSSNFGAIVELDQRIYTWTDKVYITIVAPDWNFDSNMINSIGSDSKNKIVVSTRSQKISNYKLAETGTDTGVFTGEVILTGFSDHDSNGDGNKGDATGITRGTGPTDGFLATKDQDGLSVSFEYTENNTVLGSALVRWNIGEIQWLEASYPASGQGRIRIIDPDMNLNPERVDTFRVDVWSDSDAGGVRLSVTETNEATGIFEGIVLFTPNQGSSGQRLRVSEGDTVTAEYHDRTLPSPYTRADELEIDATTFIGSIVPPLERAPASNPRIVDAFGNELDKVKVDQQIQITADLINGQDRGQPFAYLVQIQDKNEITISLSWITGRLEPGQSLNPAQSWTPSIPGTYKIQIFVWESIDNPDALSPPLTTQINVE